VKNAWFPQFSLQMVVYSEHRETCRDEQEEYTSSNAIS
jgi:hypothetical protein